MSAPERGPPVVVVVTDPQDHGERADVVLGRRAPQISRRLAKTRGLAGDLLVDGRRAAPSTRVELGASIELRMAAHASPATAVDVLFVTERFVYVDKPPGVHTVRLRPDDPPTLADAVARVHPECSGASASPHDGGAVHRLDRGTSGVVCFARERDAWEQGRRAMSDGAALKVYLARLESAFVVDVPLVSAGSVRRRTGGAPALDGIVAGVAAPTGLVVDAPLGPSSGAAGSRRVRLAQDGRDAITEVWAVTATEGSDGVRAAPDNLVVLSLRTGHRHQARVHLAALGCPIMGDPLYGTGPEGPHMLLHAAALDLGDAIDGEARVVAPTPERFWSPP